MKIIIRLLMKLTIMIRKILLIYILHPNTNKNYIYAIKKLLKNLNTKTIQILNIKTLRNNFIPRNIQLEEQPHDI